jgi:predicted nucleic acid-binding protein
VKYVLDSNIVIGALNGVPAVSKRLGTIEARDVSIPVVVVAELVYGAQRSVRREDNLAKVRQLRERFQVLPVSDGVVDRYGAVRAALEARGTPKSDFEDWLATTREY